MELSQEQSLEFVECLRKSLPPHSCQAWLNSVQLLNITPSKVVIGGIRHKVYRYDIKTNHESILRNVLNKLYPEKAPFAEKKFEYKISGRNHKQAIQPEFNLKQRKSTVKNEELLLENSKPEKHAETSVDKKHPSLLDSFIPGTRNLLASRASRAVIDLPGVAFNPFIIYGESGSGKSHLLEGINLELQQGNAKHKTILVSAEVFLNDFIVHLRTNKMKEFRDRYRKVDTFILDDLQAIVPSSKCQTELLYTINALRKKNSQIVVASLQAPTQITGLSTGLKSRLESGLTVDIGIPDDQTRITILESKAKDRGIPLSKELSVFIVQHIKGGIGRMEGVLMRLGVHASLLNEELTVDLARYALKDWLDDSAQISSSQHAAQERFSDETVKKIMQKTCIMFQISEDGLYSYRRDRKHSKARQAAVYLLKQLTPLSLSEIGKIVGRNHSTVHATLKKVRERMSADNFFIKQMETFLQEFEETPLTHRELQQKRNYRL
ncbi:MAG: ATP-binding protein [SAR324 cluster bacterium]|nr:ATP-binding protein [SAR324 cluster bacterium]MBL7035347.1 ATP-binding protein [SAR324 cluster bacterium]